MSNVIDVLFIFLIFFVGAFRDSTIGTDIAVGGSGYHMIWNNPDGYLRGIEPGFTFLTSVIKLFSSSYYVYYGLLYVINMLLYYKACDKLKINKSIFFAVLFLSSLLDPSFNVVRQMLGLSVGVWIFAIFNGKYENQVYSKLKAFILYELCILLLTILIHNSLFILMIVPVFYIKKIGTILDKDIILWIILGGAIFISISGKHIIQSVLTASVGLFGERADFYANVYATYHDSIEASHGFMTTLLNGALAILLSKNRRDTLFYVGFIGLILHSIAASCLGTIGRMFDNLSIFLCFYYARHWMNFNNSLWYIGLKLMRIAIWLSGTYFTLFANESLNPYKTFLF